MRASLPIFQKSSRTPAISGPGLAIAGPEGPVAPDGNAAWVHGALVLDSVEGRPEARGEWLRSLYVTAVDHAGEGITAANLIGDRRHYQDHTFGAALAGGTDVVVLPFGFDLARTLGVELEPGIRHVRVSARHLRSNLLTVRCREDGAGVALEGPFPEDALPPETPVDWLCQAYALSRAELHGPAADAFAKALEDREVRKDLDRANLYNGACEACRTVIAGLGKDAELHAKQAIGWLKEDLARRRDLLSAETIRVLEDEVRGDLEAKDAERLGQLRSETVAHFKNVHRGEADLKMLHGMADFEALFERAARVAARPSMPRLGKKGGPDDAEA